jgi:hypothetical protein
LLQSIAMRSTIPISAGPSRPPVNPFVTNETRRRLLGVLVSCRVFGPHRAGLDCDAYERNPIVQDAAERWLEMSGEAKRELEGFTQKHSVTIRACESSIHIYESINN